MHGIWKAIGSFVRRADMVLLSLCIAASVFGIVVMHSISRIIFGWFAIFLYSNPSLLL